MTEKLTATPQWKHEQWNTSVATKQVAYGKLVGTVDMHNLRTSSAPTARTKQVVLVFALQTVTSQKDGGGDCLQTFNRKAQRAVANTLMPHASQGSCKTRLRQAETKYCIAYTYFGNKPTLPC